ncbi:protein-L-isoaspartate O-methyltransferase [Actinorhabdospora filicis]|uniref:Protein-L-isoaspartate O-methyltransferase n=1 Tax=Actinorhabdospora filicis TaxID=1785913 RepID=A0A9W6WE05_9ACTN|nr:ATP-grasp peptide maturase system methyltransferase [Actinorhabdospora filicis]GLZ82116.1 protein-L-isoaspartate O-methyltransferase [Actinorhabdospora filicis]
MTTPEGARAELVASLTGAGSLRTDAWTRAFAAVPREVFLPRFFRQGGNSRWEAIDAAHPDWLTLVYQDRTWVTQLNNDPAAWTSARLSGPVPGYPTSSSTQPSLMAYMLEALDVSDGHRVMELGTGTGYNAALLSQRLGEDHIVSAEYDPIVAEDARRALDRLGYRPALHIGDGAAGAPDAAPFDRIIATYGPTTIAPAWITQTRPGGKILANLYRDLGGGALILLTVNDNGTASGHFLPEYGGFMATRQHTSPQTTILLNHASKTTGGQTRPTALQAAVLDHDDFGMLAALALPGIAPVTLFTDEGDEFWLLADDSSAARLALDGTVTETGPRRLWAAIETLHTHWQELGRPARERIGLTVGSTGEHTYWLDEPTTALPALSTR